MRLSQTPVYRRAALVLTCSWRRCSQRHNSVCSAIIRVCFSSESTSFVFVVNIPRNIIVSVRVSNWSLLFQLIDLIKCGFIYAIKGYVITNWKHLISSKFHVLVQKLSISKFKAFKFKNVSVEQ